MQDDGPHQSLVDNPFWEKSNGGTKKRERKNPLLEQCKALI
jgi:hypothetical protein